MLFFRKLFFASSPLHYFFSLSFRPKVVYPASYPPPPLDAYAGGVCRTIDKIMGAQTSPLEHFIVKRKFMGPQWVRIKNPNLEGTAASWCKIEVRYMYTGREANTTRRFQALERCKAYKDKNYTKVVKHNTAFLLLYSHFFSPLDSFLSLLKRTRVLCAGQPRRP